MLGVGAGITATAGCLSSLPLVGSDDVQYYEWLGEPIAEIPELVVGAPQSAFWASRPAEIASADSLSDVPVEHWSHKITPIPGDLLSRDLEPTDVDFRMGDPYRLWDVAVGSFDVSPDGLSADISSELSHGGFDVYVTEPSTEALEGVAGLNASEGDVERLREILERGVAVGDDELVVAHAVEDAATTMQNVIDVYTGERDRYVDATDAAEATANEIGGGTYVNGDIGTERPHVERVEIDGETTNVRGVLFFENDDAAADAVPSDERIAELREEDADNSIDIRHSNEIFEPYDEISIEARGRYVLLDGTLPTEDVGIVDTNLMQYLH